MRLRKIQKLIISIVVMVMSSVALAAPMPSSDSGVGQREFLLSCVYGSVAGTLVGAASLAFTDKPNRNLNRVARGASLGLYAGIMLGLYVVYGTSEDEPDPVVFTPAPVTDPVTGYMDGGMLATAFTF